MFTDADLSYPLVNVQHIVAPLRAGADVAIGSRADMRARADVPPGLLGRAYARHLAGRAFNLIVRLTLLPGVLDTQAGIKGLTAEAARLLFSDPTISGFGFDLECLHRAQRLRLRIDQVPVRSCWHDEPSTVRIVRHGVTMLADVARIRWRSSRHGAADRAAISVFRADGVRRWTAPPEQESRAERS